MIGGLVGCAGGAKKNVKVGWFSGGVIELSLGKELDDFNAGILHPQWSGFNDFIEHYVGLS